MNATATVRALAQLEARRYLRSPWLALALLLVAGWTWLVWPISWSGARYMALPGAQAPLLATVTVLVAHAFQRERTPWATEAPAPEEWRSAGRLLGALPLVLLVCLTTAVGALLLRWHGGLDLGDEPGRTEGAHYSWAELLQQGLLAVVAVCLGALLGRRCRHLATALLLAALVWFLAGAFYWVFQGPSVTPFSLIQTQPVTVPLGPPSTDPTTYPNDWFLTAPGQYQDYWARAFVSVRLAWWHDVWLLGVAQVLLALAVTWRHRYLLLGSGLVTAAVAAVLQIRVIP